MSRYIITLLAALWAQIAFATPGPHEPFEVTGTVSHNHDGDSFKLSTESKGTIDVRLSGADTPESGQAHWKVARDYFRDLVAEKAITAWCYKRDRYEREVCHVSVGTEDLGLALIRQGLAWFAVRYSKELPAEMRTSYQAAEDSARSKKLGLWIESDPQPPWECRKLKKSRVKCR